MPSRRGCANASGPLPWAAHVSRPPRPRAPRPAPGGFLRLDRGFLDGLRSSIRTLCRHAVPHLRQVGPETAGLVARPMAQLRRYHAALHAARDPAHRLRSRYHPFRSRQQLRAALRQRRDQLRPPAEGGFPPLSRRAADLDQGRLGHVAGPLRQRRRLAQVRAGEPRPEPRAHGPRLCRHLLFASLRRAYAAGGNRQRAGHGGEAGQGAVRGRVLVLGRQDARARSPGCWPRSACRC